MAWVKEWDQCVFGKRAKRRKQEHEDVGVGMRFFAVKSRAKIRAPQAFQYLDEYHRPREKVGLLFVWLCRQ
jgi:hypothetical protein